MRRRAIAGSYPTQQGEASCRLRNGGSQIVRVEHVHVNEGGQTVIGNVNSVPGLNRPQRLVRKHNAPSAALAAGHRQAARRRGEWIQMGAL